ncbi:hypothetical protein EOS_41065 [Caballeronia mineralivorans PML1(12)]|uniref:Cobalt-zinc-cadmium resistance protein n=1 Tax=Caballeronia mineralivorans PML1(12) TaxID=908627 RepID=A0A0J1CJ62_9BURK|nr:hypothetical protein [Caballeronia mineralivorans]KLU20501.1 hypothetical protein EOS_41065 [Caballeronia mineralivorans PML1(12)]
MKRAVKFFLCFLIAWLPLTGFATQALICPQVSSAMTGSHTAPHSTVPHTIASARAAHLATTASTTHQADCHDSIGSLACTPAATPSHPVALVAASATPVYASVDATAFPQFIPDLPQRPPQVL